MRNPSKAAGSDLNENLNSRSRGWFAFCRPREKQPGESQQRPGRSNAGALSVTRTRVLPIRTAFSEALRLHRKPFVPETLARHEETIFNRRDFPAGHKQRFLRFDRRYRW